MSIIRYYPSPSKTGDLHDDFRLLFKHVYDLQDKLRERDATIDQMKREHEKLANTVGSKPWNSQIAGLNVKAAVPTNGQKLTYVAASGDIEWQ